MNNKCSEARVGRKNYVTTIYYICKKKLYTHIQKAKFKAKLNAKSFLKNKKKERQNKILKKSLKLNLSYFEKNIIDNRKFQSSKNKIKQSVKLRKYKFFCNFIFIPWLLKTNNCEKSIKINELMQYGYIDR